MRDRDLAHEREMMDLAARAAGVVAAEESLSAFADSRALPGGLRPRSIEGWRREIEEELADARNYCVWMLLSIRPSFEKGESWACDCYVQALGCLVGVLSAWQALHRTPS